MVKNVFVPTANYQKCQTVKDQLLEYRYGLDMAVLMGRAGRGKTTVALKLAAMDSRVVFVSYSGWLSHTGIVREICFAVAGTRPRATQACFELLEQSFSERRRLVLVDEADRMGLRCLNVLRDLHDRCGVAIVLVGEEPLRGKLAQERRLISRISQEVVFQEVTASDVALFYRRSLDLEISAKIACGLAKHAQGDFRLVMKCALHVERIMRASGLNEITDDVVAQVCR